MTNSSETKEGANEEKMNENETEHLFEETISDSETSDCGNENIPLFNICTETYNMNVKSPEIPLLHPIPIPKEMEESVKQNKQLDFLRPETEENSYADSHFDIDKRIKKLNSCIKNGFSVDSSALIDRNLIERIINDLNPDIPSRENFPSYQKSNSEKGLSTKVDNTETETFENENRKSDTDNVHVVERMSKYFTTDIESEKIAWEYSQQSLFQNTSFIDDTFDGSQPLFVSSQSQDVFDSAINIASNEKWTYNSEDFLHSNSQELFSTQVFIKDNKDLNIDIYSNEYISTEHSYSKVLKNGICERTNSFNNDGRAEIIFLKKSGNETSTDKNNLFTMNRKEDENADSSKISPASDSILKADKVNGSNEKTLESSHKTDIKNYQNEFMYAPSTSLKINLTNEQDMQPNYDYKDSLPIMDQEDESTKSLSDRDSSSPSLLVPNEKHQKKETENKNIENCNSKSECCSNVFDYVKNIKVVQGSFKKTSIIETEREINTNNREVSTVCTDYASKYTTHCNTDSNSIIRLGHNNHNFIKLWLLKTDSIQDGKVANNPNRIFKSKSTRCSNRFQVPWKKIYAEEKNLHSERIQENLDAIEKCLKNNKQTSNRKLQQEFQNVDRMNAEKEIEQQIILTDISICVNNTPSENREIDKIEFKNELYPENVAEIQSRTENLTELHEGNISDIRDRRDNDSSVEKHLQNISDGLLSSEVENVNAENLDLFPRDDNCISESNGSGKETEQQINLPDPRICVNNTHSKNREIELQNELNTENVAEVQSRTENHLTELHEGKMADIHNRPENDSSVEKRIYYISDNLPSSEDKKAIAENSELSSRDNNCISESNKSNISGKGASEATRQISEIEIAKVSGTCKVNQNMPSIALRHISTESNEKFSTKVRSIVNFNQEENLNLKSSESFTTNKMPGYKRKRKTRYRSVYANYNHSYNYPESLHEASKHDEKLDIEKECETYSDSDIEILEEFVVRKIKVEGQRISNLNLKSSESFTTNKMPLRKRKRKICHSSIYANINHSNICPETSKDDEKLEIKKECESYSDNDIEILEEFIVRKFKVESQKTSERMNGRYRQLDFISKSSTKKKLQKEGPKAIFSHKKQILADNFDFSEKEKHLLEKIESKLHHIAKIIKVKRHSEIRKQKALILLKEMSPILEKAETFCNNFQMNSQNYNNFSNGTFVPFKLKQLQFLYSNLMKEIHSSLKLQEQNSNEIRFSKYLVRSVESEEQKKQGKLVSGGEVYERSNDKNFPSSSKNSNEPEKDRVTSRLVNCDAHFIKRKSIKINNETVQTHVNDEFNLNLGNKHMCDASFETLINKKKANISTCKERRSENITLITEKESDMADKENVIRNVIINYDSTVALNDSVNFSNETQCFESLDTDFNRTTVDKGSGRETTTDLVGELSYSVQKNSPVILKFSQGTDAPVDSVPILQDNITNKEYCNEELTTTEVNNHVNNNSSNRFDDESNMTVDEIQNSLDETQSLVGLDKDLEIIPFEREIEDNCTEFSTQNYGEEASQNTFVVPNFNTVKEYDSVSLIRTLDTGNEKKEERIIIAPALNSLTAMKQNTTVLPSSKISLSNIEKTVLNNSLAYDIDSRNRNFKAIKNYEANKSNSMKSFLQDSNNKKCHTSRKIHDALPNDKETSNVVIDCDESQNTQSNNALIKSVNSKPVKVHITNDKEKNHSLIKKACNMPINNMSGKCSSGEFNKFCNAKKWVDIENQSMPSRETGEVTVTSVNNISNSFISNSLQQNTNFKDSSSNFYIKPMPNEMNCGNINLNHSTPRKNPQGLQILSGNRPNEISIATTRMLSNDCVHHSLSQNISDFKGNCNSPYATISTPDIMNSCNNNLNHSTPLKNLQDLHTLNGNKLNKSTIATSQQSIGELKSGFKTQRIMKRKTKVLLIELIQHNLLQPGENVLSVHTPEKIVFGSLDDNGKIISNCKIYSSPLQWYYDIPNFCKSAPKPSKSKPCYDKIYYQGRTLSHFVDIYHQGLENRNTSPGIEESSVILSSSTGLEVTQRSIAPLRVSAASTEVPISRPNGLNLLKMKLLLIEDNEVGHMSETVQWDDIDKWD